MFFLCKRMTTLIHVSLWAIQIFFLFFSFFRTAMSSFTFSLLLVMAASAEMPYLAFDLTKLHPFSFPAYLSWPFKVLKIVVSKEFAVFSCLLSSVVLIKVFSDSSLVPLMKIFIKVQESPQQNLSFHNKLFVAHLWGHFFARFTKSFH